MTQHPSSLSKPLAALAALLGVAVACAPAPAGGCGYYSGYNYGYTPYYYPNYPVYNNYEIKKYTVFETVPVYAVGVYAGYVAPPQAPAAAAAPAPATSTPAQETCETRLSAFRDRLLALEARLGAGAASSPGGYATPPPPPEKEYAPPRRERERPVEPPPMAPVTGTGNGGGKYPTFAAKCLGCHAAAVAKQKGGDHAFVTPLSPQGVNACLKEMMAGHMPPGSSKLTDQEFTVIMGELLNVPAGGAK